MSYVVTYLRNVCYFRLPKRCKYDDCTFEAMMPNIMKHEEDCLYRPVQCPDLKCNKKIPFIGVLDHIEECLNEDEILKFECNNFTEFRVLTEDHFLST